MNKNDKWKREAHRAIENLRRTNCDGAIEDASIVGDFLANLMHLHGEGWVQDRVAMAGIHFADETFNANHKEDT
tara:strand:+ start:514 stop:735 length:222 start_codon:yes stop_codon:yes gene_type:complete